jgi:predicted regulator of Ras-like GTPase activity (Roadblock/LC7/MglB family)
VNFEEKLKMTKEKIPGALSLSLIGIDGIPIETIGESNLDIETLSAEITTFLRNLSLANSELKIGKLNQLALLCEEHIHLLAAITKDYYLFCILESKGYFGKARYELLKLSYQLKEELA